MNKPKITIKIGNFPLQQKDPIKYTTVKLFSTTSQFRRSVLNDCEKFNIFGSVHAMNTEISPFDSEIKDSTNSSLLL
jgi:hypothetical protein